MRAIVTCESCRHRQWLVRAIDRAESFHVICERCERVLQVSVTDDHLAAALASSPGSGAIGERRLLGEGDGGAWQIAGGSPAPLV